MLKYFISRDQISLSRIDNFFTCVCMWAGILIKIWFLLFALDKIILIQQTKSSPATSLKLLSIHVSKTNIYAALFYLRLYKSEPHCFRINAFVKYLAGTKNKFLEKWIKFWNKTIKLRIQSFVPPSNKTLYPVRDRPWIIQPLTR
jgi:hypothetical protein